ncbi:MAG: CPBP family intramembrane metalloprotease [Eubacterium sp.]|nr:CPBP family intramembrane metalloprotease [Eubacterium sp.]
MKRKGITLAWVLLYIGIAVALQFVMSFMMLGIIYKIALTEGLTNSGAVAKLMELGLGISAGADEISANGAFTMVLTGLCDFIMFTGFGLWYYFRENKYPFRPDYRKAFTRSNTLAIVGIAIFGQFAINLILRGFQIVLPSIFRQYEELAKNFDLDTMNPVIMLFIVCLLGPLAEEVLFRGMIYAKLRRGFSMWPAAIISGLLFGAYHMNWVQGIYATIIGVVLAYIYEKTQTIWGSCLLHVAFNSSSYLLDILTGWLEQIDSVILGIVMILFELACCGIVILLMRHFHEKRTHLPEVNLQNPGSYS